MTTNAAFAPIVDALTAKLTTDVSELHSISKTYKARNGSAPAVEEWLKNSEDAEIRTSLERIAAAEAKIKEMRKELTDKARAALVPDGFDGEEVAKDFKEKRKNVRTLLMQGIGTLSSLDADVSELETMLENLPNIGGGVSASGKSPEEMEAIRKWARENGHDVKERGRIAKDVIEEFEKANA